MKTLKRGSRGAQVRRWQLFLIGQGLSLGLSDGDFGPATERATLKFQVQHRLFADGVVGPKTLGQAMVLGFDNGLVKPTPVPISTPATADAHAGAPNWPPRPAELKPLTSTAARQKLFGAFKFAPEPVAGNAENIRILGDWEDKNIVRVEIPQLRGIVGAPASGQVRFHQAAAPQLQKLWQAWEDAGVLPLIKTWDGSFVPRFVRGSRSNLSNHCFGSAFDINASFNSLGTRPAVVGRAGSVRALVPIANQLGFFWGGHYNGRPDGMHFEIARLD